MAILAMTAVAGEWIVGRLVKADLNAVNLAWAAVLAWLFGCAIAGATARLTGTRLGRACPGPGLGAMPRPGGGARLGAATARLTGARPRRA